MLILSDGDSFPAESTKESDDSDCGRGVGFCGWDAVFDG